VRGRTSWRAANASICRVTSAEDVLKLVISMALTWSAASLTHYGAEDAEADLERHRQALSLAVSRILRP
jgi:hypothetical protein